MTDCGCIDILCPHRGLDPNGGPYDVRSTTRPPRAEPPDVVAFLNARYDELASAAAEAQKVYPGPYEVNDRGSIAKVVAAGPVFRDVVTLEQWPDEPPDSWLGDYLRHFAFHDPASVLADIAAKRAILAWASAHPRTCNTEHPQFDVAHPDGAHGPNEVAVLLAQPFSAHPDFDPAWTVET